MRGLSGFETRRSVKRADGPTAVTMRSPLVCFSNGYGSAIGSLMFELGSNNNEIGTMKLNYLKEKFVKPVMMFRITLLIVVLNKSDILMLLCLYSI